MTTSKNDGPRRVSLQEALALLDPVRLSMEIEMPHEEARLSFSGAPALVRSEREFHELVGSYFAHHQGRVTLGPGITWDFQPGAFAIELLNRVMNREGGAAAAYRKCLTGMDGGVRSVLDAMADTLKRDSVSREMTRIFTTVIPWLDYEAKVSLVQELLDHMAGMIPEEFKSRRPEELAMQFEILLQGYAQTLGRYRELTAPLEAARKASKGR